MAFCSNCGKELAAGDKFCSECGTPVRSTNASERKIVYDGELHKCPNCGELLISFLSVCPTCGHEIRGATNSMAAREFAMRLEMAGSQQEKITVIRNYPIPNTKEDIFEFLILASSNVSDNLDNGISKAWQSKVEQAYQKAQLVFKNSDEYAYIQGIYNRAMAKLAKDRKSKKAKRAGASMSKLMPSMPNIIIVSVWVLSVLVLIPFCGINSDDDGIGFSLLLMAVLVAGAVGAPYAFQCKSTLPKVIAILGLVLSILILIGLCSINNEATTSYELILMTESICGIIILVDMFKKKK